MSGFGLAHIKGEGAPIHPDDTDCNWSDHKAYMRQAKAYYDHYGLTDEWKEFKKDNE
ncbi:MAG: hypothetical protein JRJ39_00455 [Deltaproteobacteria bacterium]|nr:hypothetical protein [Deltaproteobacteria bacterium]MBW1845579.1 hypothetical protein [Deltaproteobacteria bacterium]MBW2032008.1 hypothetical protein [Deltaproteobacteria bacterium]MBW2180968.1 hypothetical protein [Deltaproteobacteria bacterium]